MQYRYAMLVLGAFVGGCAVFTTDDMHYSIFFRPHSAELDPQGQATVRTAAAVAKENLTLPITLAGYASPPDPADNDVLSAQRAAAVQHAMIRDGVEANRIVTQANGTADPNGLPNLSVQRVDISIGR